MLYNTTVMFSTLYPHLSVSFQLDIMHLEILRLPITRLMLENACYLMQRDSTTAWPLICDPTSRVIEWLMYYMRDQGLVEVKYSVCRKMWNSIA